MKKEPTFFEVQATQREVNNCRVLLLNEVVLGETLEMNNDVRWQPLAFIASQMSSRFLGGNQLEDHEREA